jgi:hypothetical protein
MSEGTWKNPDRGGQVIRPTKHLLQRRSRRDRQRRFRATVRRFERSPVPLFGLPPSWTGVRWLAGSSWDRDHGGRADVIEALVLGHRLGEAEGPRLLVQSEAPGLAQSRSELQSIAEEFWRNGAASVGEAVDRLRAQSRVAQEADIQVPIEDSAEIVIDGSPSSFRVLRRSDSWVASCQLPNVWITLEADGFDVDDVEVVTVTDLTQYIDGTRGILFSPKTRP